MKKPIVFLTLAMLFFPRLAFSTDLTFIDEPEVLRIGKESQEIMMATMEGQLNVPATYIYGQTVALRFPINSCYKAASALEFIINTTETDEAVAVSIFLVNINLEQNIKHLREALDDVRIMKNVYEHPDELILYSRLEQCIRDSILLLEDMKERCSAALPVTPISNNRSPAANDLADLLAMPGNGSVDQGANNRRSSSQSESGIYDPYSALVILAIQPNWSAASFSRDNLTVQVRIVINADGLILSQRVERSSGNAAYDASVLNSIERTRILPKPPTRAQHEVIINFNSLQMGG